MTTYRLFASLARMGCKVKSAMVLVCCVFLVTSGCSKGPSFEMAVKRDLMMLGLEIHNFQSSIQSDLEAKSSDAKKIIESGTYVLLPGIDMDLSNLERSKIIVAYHKDTPSKGGYALNGDGSVELFTIEEFQKAQKCVPKSNPPDADSKDTRD